MGSDTQGALDVPADLANGMLGLDLLAGRFESVQIVAFTPKPRFLDVLLGPAFDVPWVRESTPGPSGHWHWSRRTS